MAAAVCSAGARLLDVHSDGDHNRSVFTFVGTAGEMELAAVLLAREAVARIDLRVHTGVHPRIGAIDVVPFVPLGGSTMGECVSLARCTGAAVADETGVPVFLYGEAATDPARASLAALRRGGLDALGTRIGREGWVPDFGPPRLHPAAGACCVGARGPLVAYNVSLESTNLDIGRRIASALREKNGGPRGVQALAFFLERKGCVQISMNLTDIESTSVPEAFRRVSDLARAAGVQIGSSEIVGLASRRALAGATTESLRLTDRLEDHVLDPRWEAA
jgi:glutamate formiminotransferase